MLTPSPIRVVIDKLHVTNTECDSKKFIYQVEKSEYSISNKEIMGGNIEKSNTSIPLEVILVITEFTDVFHKDSTSFLPKVTPVTMEFDDVLSEDISGKLPPPRDIQHAVDDLPHLRLNLSSKLNAKSKLISCH